MTRQDQITAYRLKQPIDELWRKAMKAISKHRVWTQEEVDYCKAKAVDWQKLFGKEV